MNQDLKKAIINAYNDSNKDRKKFEKIISNKTGLTKSGMSRGEVADMISTFIFKENYQMKLSEVDNSKQVSKWDKKLFEDDVVKILRDATLFWYKEK